MDILIQSFETIWHVIADWVIPIIFVLTLVVFFHELGHFLVARFFNVKIDAFSVGFGREIFGFTDKQDTRWKFCWIPLGGYVKFADDASAASTPDQDALKNLSEDDKKRSFHLKPLWQKSLVVAAGPIASFLLGVVIFAGINYSQGQYGPSTLIDRVIAGSVAEKAGLQKGDKITHINGDQITFFNDIFRIVSLSANDELNLTILRDSKSFDVTAKPRSTMVDNGFGRKISMGQLGIAPSRDKSTWHRSKYSFLGAIVKGGEQTKFIVTSTLGYIGKLFTGRESPDKLNGPIGIGKIVNQFADFGIISTLYIAALLSVSIGLFNLFPVPLLDGGHLMMYGIEAVRGRPISDKVMEYSFRVGLVVLLALMLLATKNDISWFN